MSAAPAVASGGGDEPTRQAVRTELDATLFVEAGAGTGKTTALVGRVLALVGSGRAGLGQIAAITFTEAAAAELRDRITDELERRLEAGHRDPDPERPGDPDGTGEWRARYAAALEEVDAAPIGTLHGFARRLLSEHPFEAGLPPTFEVLDDVRSGVAFEERWTRFLDDLLGEPVHGRAVSRALLCGVRLEHIRALARQCNENWDLLADEIRPPRPPLPVDAGSVLSPLRGALALAGACSSPEDKLLVHLESLAEWAEELGEAEGDVDTLRLVAGGPRLTRGNVGKAEQWGGTKDEVVGLLADAERARQELVGRIADDALDHLLGAVRELTLRAAGERRREGRLEFHDLLVQARNLLRSRSDVVAAVRDQYRFLLIDEFQDTDPIQSELAFRIASSEPGEGDWRGMTPDPGRLFFVGDPKQSIYRFRRANIAQFMEVRDRVVARPLQLTRNFRSVPGVVASVNALFGALVGDGLPGAQPRYEPLRADRPGHGRPAAEPPVVLLGMESHDTASAEERRRHAAADIVECIRRAVAEGWPVGEEGRPATKSDITVLVPTRTGVPTLQRAFDAADIPYRLEAMSLVYSSAEVRDLLTVLRAVDDSADEVSIVAALRSPSLGCGDDDLLEYKLAGGRWNYRDEPPHGLAGAHPVVDGMRRLRELHDQRWWFDVSSLMERVLAEFRLYELALDDRRHRERWRRLRFVVGEARLFADAFGGDLRTYLRWADLQCEEDARVTEAILPEPDDDAVRVMTVHAAKGLEFPIVVMAGLGAKGKAADTTRILWGPDGHEVSISKALRSPGFALLEADDALKDQCERVRLLYVAATRARDHLVLDLHRKTGEESPAALVEAVCAEHPALWRNLGEGALPVRPEQPGASGGGLTRPPGAPAEPAGEDREGWLRRRAELLGRADVPHTLAATAVAKLAMGRRWATAAPGPEAAEEEWEDEEPGTGDGADEGRPSWRRGRAGTAIGRAVHATLQVLDLASAEGLDDLARAQAAAEGVSDQAAEVAALARAAVGSELVRRAVERGRYWRELYVGAPIGDRLLEGFVDLLVEGPDGYEVVDYKTDRVRTDEDVERSLDRYRIQGAAYAVALEEALGSPVVRCTFLFLREGEAVAKEVADLPVAKAEVRRIMEGV
jgi:ATP-dependent exoDNAse (exonuclease V) beta subunit